LVLSRSARAMISRASDSASLRRRRSIALTRTTANAAEAMAEMMTDRTSPDVTVISLAESAHRRAPRRALTARSRRVRQDLPHALEAKENSPTGRNQAQELWSQTEGRSDNRGLSAGRLAATAKARGVKPRSLIQARASLSTRLCGATGRQRSTWGLPAQRTTAHIRAAEAQRPSRIPRPAWLDRIQPQHGSAAVRHSTHRAGRHVTRCR
jgi:hypothetical protein